MKKLLLIALTIMVLVAMSACKGDAYGDVFVNRKPVTFHVCANNGNPISNVEVKAEELDSFDNDPIINRTRSVFTDFNGIATITDAAFDHESRTNRFTFVADDYVVFDTLFSSWTDTIDIVLCPSER